MSLLACYGSNEIWLVVLRLNVPVNNFSVMSGRSSNEKIIILCIIMPVFKLYSISFFRFLATGESFRSLAYSYRVGRATVGRIVKEVCKVLWERLQPLYMALPKTAEEWQVIAANFDVKWHFPHCLGAIDGKHVVM